MKRSVGPAGVVFHAIALSLTGRFIFVRSFDVLCFDSKPLSTAPQRQFCPCRLHHVSLWSSPSQRPELTGDDPSGGRIASEQVRSRLMKELENLREKDRQSRPLSPHDLKVVFEDDHLVLIDKPSGILTVPSESGVPSLVQAVFERFQKSTVRTNRTTYDVEPISTMDQMVVHRLGMETSGLIVFAKSREAVRGLNALFRTRRITRQYQVLVCGHVVPHDEGWIRYPLMRDYEHPPYMRVSTDAHQRYLARLDPEIVGRKLLEAPKASLTHYRVMSREYLDGNNASLPVTRLTLTSLTGRTHQLNVHMAAFGHPIVQDRVYGRGGSAAPRGGLPKPELSPYAVGADLEEAVQAAAAGWNMCVHASCVKFVHPVTQELIACTSEAVF